MRKRLASILGATLLLFSIAVVAASQVPATTVTKVQQNPDGTYTVIEYPVGKETVVTLNPVGIPATGTATILRAADGTTIKLNLASVPTDVTGLNLYAVDPTGAVSLLGPITIADGTKQGIRLGIALRGRFRCQRNLCRPRRTLIDPVFQGLYGGLRQPDFLAGRKRKCGRHENAELAIN